MFEANVKIISELKEFIQRVSQTSEALERFKVSEVDFSRNRKLAFERFVLLSVKLCKKYP